MNAHLFSRLARHCNIHRAKWLRPASSSAADARIDLKSLSDIPGPKGLPLIGNLHQLWKVMDKGGEQNWFHQLYQEYGPIAKTKMATYTTLSVTDVKGIEELFRNEGSRPSRGFEENIKWIHNKNKMSDGLAFSVGETWKKLRSAMSRQVVPRRVANYTPGLCKISEDLCDHLAAQKDIDGWVGDIFDATGKWSLKGVSFVMTSKLM